MLARSDDGVIAIDVIDNGKGFPKENRQRLLEPYMTTRAEGTGLGLPIVAKILEDHGGGIELLDAPGGKGAGRACISPTPAKPPRGAKTWRARRSPAAAKRKRGTAQWLPIF